MEVLLFETLLSHISMKYLFRNLCELVLKCIFEMLLCKYYFEEVYYFL